jgi:acyl-CoA thioesterase
LFTRITIPGKNDLFREASMIDTEKARKIFDRDRYAKLSGVELVEAGSGFCTARMKVDDRHLNAANVVQGGAIFTLADFAFAVASNSHGQLALAINVHISYLQAVSAGTLYAVASEVDTPKRLGVYEVIVKDEQERIIATFNGMVYRKNKKVSGL